MLPIGTKVRIKSYEEIQKTLDKDDICDGLYFNPKMQDYCGTLCWILSQGSNYYKLGDIPDYYWSPQWLDVVKDTDYLNDGSIEQRSLCLALIRQVMSGNKPDVECLKRCNSVAFPIDAFGGFSYNNYPQDEWRIGTKIAENIPDWPCLKLKPEILEEAIKNCLLQYDLQYFKGCVTDIFKCWFRFNETEKPDFWYKVADTLNTIPSKTVKDTNIEQPIKKQKDEIKFQRRKSTILRGTVPEGSQQSSGKCKATTCSGYLGYQVCTGR